MTTKSADAYVSEHLADTLLNVRSAAARAGVDLARATLSEGAGNEAYSRTAFLGHVRARRILIDQLANAQQMLVDEALRCGATWAEVGDALNLTRQGAHRRHGSGSAR